MAYPTVFASAKTEPGGTGSTITPTLPTHAVGDEIVIFIGNTGSTAYSAPAGWTLRDQGIVGSASTGVVGTLLYHRVVSGDTLPLSSPVVSLGATVTRFAHAVTLRGAEIDVHLTGPEWVFGRATGTANPVRPPSVTTVAPEQEALIFYVAKAATNAPDQTGYTQVQESIASGTVVVNSSRQDIAAQGTVLSSQDASPTSGARWVAMILCAPSDDYPYYRFGAQATVASGTSVTPALPTGTTSSDINGNKDLIVATVQAAGNNIAIAPNTPADWTEITGFATNTSGNGTTVRKYWTLYDGSLDLAFTRPTAGELSVCLTTYRNTHQSSPIGAVNIRQNASSTTSTWDALTRTFAKVAVQATCVADGTPSYTAPTGWIERMDGLGIVCSDQTYDAVGSAASASYTLSAASPTAVGLVEIRGQFVDPALTLTLSDNASNLADTLGKVGGQLKTFADDTNNLSDAFAQVEGQQITFSDNANNIADGAVKVVGVATVVADSLQALTDALIKLVSYELALADSEAANWVDSHQLLLAHQMALADNAANWLDSEAHFVGLLPAFNDALPSLADAPALSLGYSLAVADNAGNLADSETHTVELRSAFSDSIDDLVESVNLNLGQRLNLPYLDIFDNFNRADGNLITGNWGNTDPTASGTVDILDSSVVLSGTGAGFAYWIPDVFTDVAVSITVKTLPLNLGSKSIWLQARMQQAGEVVDPNPAWDGYEAGWTRNSETAGSAVIDRVLNGSSAVLATIPGVELSDGDKIKLVCTGSNISFWTFHSGVWTNVLNVDDSTYASGKVGFEIHSASAVLDDFAASAITNETILLVDDASLGNRLLLDLSDGPLNLTDATNIGLNYLIAVFDNNNNLADVAAPQLSQQVTITDSLPIYIDYVTACLYLLGIEIECVDSEARVGLEFYESFAVSDAFDYFLFSITSDIQLDLSDDYALTDAVAADYGLSVTDTVTIVDALQLQWEVAASDAIDLTDSATLQLNCFIVLDDALALTDSAAHVAGLNVGASDTIVLSDSCSFEIDQRVSCDDTIDSFADSTAQQLDYLAACSDTLVLNDSSTLLLSYFLSLSSDINILNDSIQTNAPQGPDIQLGVVDALAALSDQLAAQLAYLLDAVDVITFNDSASQQVAYFTSLSDNFTFSESSSFTLGHLQPLADVVVLSDSIQLLVGYEAVVADAVALNDSIIALLGFNVSLTDNAALLADSAAKSLGLGIIIADNAAAFSEAIELFAAGLVQLNDVLSLTDAVARFSAVFLPLEDSLSITDSMAVELRGPDREEAVGDALQLADAIAVVVSNELKLQLLFSDSITLSDHYFDIRHPYTPSIERHVVVLSRSRSVLVAGNERTTVIPARDRTTKVI